MEDPVMSAAVAAPQPPGIPVHDVEAELSRQLNQFKEAGTAPVQRAHMANLILFCDRNETACQLTTTVPDIVTIHPARILVLVAEPASDAGDVRAEVSVWCQPHRGGPKVCSEQITLRAKGAAVDRLPFAVRGLLIGDLPTNIWWLAAQPPPLAGHLLYALAEQAEQVVYDSIGWKEPARGVAATASWLERFERGPGQGLWRVASDLNWRRLKYWRRLAAQALDPMTAPGALESITEVLVEHGPHAVVQAWLFASWLAARLGWQVQAGKVKPGVEIAWQVQAPHGNLCIRLRRLAEGPPEIQRARIACTLDRKPGAFNFTRPEANRLAVVPEGVPGAPRTVTLPPQPLPDLVARQLSDRERDPVFRESMTVAEVFARSVMG
jgi:glucose-6-phosphate dehydrogenase assembly protein OpcA